MRLQEAVKRMLIIQTGSQALLTPETECTVFYDNQNFYDINTVNLCSFLQSYDSDFMQMPEVRNWWNIRLAGKTKSIPENNTMWNVLTTASATPILELDFLGADAHEMLGFSDQAKFAALQSGMNPHYDWSLELLMVPASHVVYTVVCLQAVAE